MCGVSGGVTKDYSALARTLEMIKHLEPRGYESAGVGILTRFGDLVVRKVKGKIAQLLDSLKNDPLPEANVAISHTRWPTSGEASETNAHPQVSETVAVVHNGTIENYLVLQHELEQHGFTFVSETDTEVIAHLIRHLEKNGADLLTAVQGALLRLIGDYAILVISASEPDTMIAACKGSPLIVGMNDQGHFIASDHNALSHFAEKCFALEDGDVVKLQRNQPAHIFNDGNPVCRIPEPVTYRQRLFEHTEANQLTAEIKQQPDAISETCAGKMSHGMLLRDCFGAGTDELFRDAVQAVHVVACGTSYHAGLVLKYWLALEGIPCEVFIASDYTMMPIVVLPGTALIAISQSGETADTRKAVHKANGLRYVHTFAICNAQKSQLTRLVNTTFYTSAGPEVSVGSTKAYTTQLVALRLFSIALARAKGLIDGTRERTMLTELRELPALAKQILRTASVVEALSYDLIAVTNMFYLGRGLMHYTGMEGALKMKELSYIHAESVSMGELKHGSLALIEPGMWCVICMLNDSQTVAKDIISIGEITLRGGKCIVVHEEGIDLSGVSIHTAINVGRVPETVASVLMVLPLQLLALYAAERKGANVDMPRNLAKTVTTD